MVDIDTKKGGKFLISSNLVLFNQNTLERCDVFEVIASDEEITNLWCNDGIFAIIWVDVIVQAGIMVAREKPWESGLSGFGDLILEWLRSMYDVT